MKQKQRFLVLSGCLLLLAALFFQYIKDIADAPMPEPSLPAGYYDQPITLELIAPAGGKIYYTTDGSTPTLDSTLYQGGIQIQDRSPEPNIYNAQQRVVADWKNYTPDPTPVPKGTVIRAIYVSSIGTQSPILTQTYFVGITPPETGYTLSLVFEPEDLFGEEGIHITGTEYDNWYKINGYIDGAHLSPLLNYMKKTEVPAVAEFMDASRNVLNQSVGLRLQGRASRREKKKPFTITAREEYDGGNVFDTMLFENVSTHSIMLKNYLTDVITSDLAADRSVAVLHSKPVQVFLNGEFWYSRYIMERYDKQYFRQYYQVDNRILVKEGIPNEDNEEGTFQSAYDEYMYWVDTNDFSDPVLWEAFQKETDVQSYIDYLVINYYLCNVDFAEYTNYVVWRSPANGTGFYEDTRWRWCIYDIGALEWIPNYPERFGNTETLNLFSEEFMFSQLTIYNALKANPEFCQRFVLSFMDMVNNNFRPENVETVLAKYGESLDWQDGFFQKRPEYAVKYLAEEFNLSGSMETVTISTEIPEGGSVTVNTSQLDLSAGPWSGTYFTDYPITISAIPADGYRFVGWKGDVSETNSTVTLPVDGGLKLEAVFAKR